MLRRVASVVRLVVFSMAAMVGTLVAELALAQSTPTLPDIGVNMEDTVDAVGSGLGGMIQPMLLLFGAILVAKLGMRWLRRTSA